MTLSLAMALLLLIGLNACSSSNQNVTASTANAENSSELTNSNKIEEQLVGRWEAKYEDNILVFLFTSKGKVIMWEVGDTKASDYGKYSLDFKGYLTVLNVIIKDEVVPLGSIRLSSKEIMRYQRSYSSSLNDIYAFKSFNKNAIMFEKISDSDKLPFNLELKTVN